MGRKRRRADRQAMSQVGAPPSPPHPRPTAPPLSVEVHGPSGDRWTYPVYEFGSASAYVRDVVTGERVAVADLAGRALFRVRAEDKWTLPPRRQRSGVGDERIALPSPLQLHDRVTDGLLGGKRYSSPFARRIGGMAPAAVMEERRLAREWWDDPYVVSRLATHMTPERFAVAMARLALRWPYERLARGVVVKVTVAGCLIAATVRRHDRDWLAGCEYEARRVVREHYLPRDPRAERDRQADRQAERVVEADIVRETTSAGVSVRFRSSGA